MMQTETTHRAKPVQQAERRAAAAERQVEKERAAGALDRETVRRLIADLADMREDRDRWRAQAEKLTVALDRLRTGDLLSPAPALYPAVPAATEIPADDLLYGVPAISTHMNLKPAQVYHLHRKGALPLFKVGEKVCWSKSGHARWLATQEGR